MVALIRLADELVRDYMRVNLERLKLRNIPTESKVHWWIHHYTRAVDITDGIIRILFRLPESYKKNQSELAHIISEQTKSSVEKQFREVKKVLWNNDIKLALEIKAPTDDPNAFGNQPTRKPVPRDLSNFMNEKFSMLEQADGAGKI